MSPGRFTNHDTGQLTITFLIYLLETLFNFLCLLIVFTDLVDEDCPLLRLLSGSDSESPTEAGRTASANVIKTYSRKRPAVSSFISKINSPVVSNQENENELQKTPRVIV